LYGGIYAWGINVQCPAREQSLHGMITELALKLHDGYRVMMGKAALNQRGDGGLGL